MYVQNRVSLNQAPSAGDVLRLCSSSLEAFPFSKSLSISADAIGNATGKKTCVGV